MYVMNKMPKATSGGVTLIEVLITLLVLSIGLLGLGALQSFSLQSGQLAYQRTQATNIAYQVADEMRAYRGQGAVPGGVSARWTALATELLPNGAVATTGPTAADEITVTVTWSDGRDPQDDSSTTDTTETDSVSVVTRI